LEPLPVVRSFMTLRSRKPGEREKRQDAESQFLRNADEPLRQLHVQTEAFNLLWRDFTFKLSCVLVLHSLYALYSHLDNVDHMGFDTISGLFYICSAIWLRNSTNSAENFTLDRFFRISIGLTASQVAFFFYILLEKGEHMEKEFIPLTAFFTLITAFNMKYMSSTVNTIKTSRILLEASGKQQ